MSGLSNTARTEKTRADQAEALRLWEAGYSRTAIRARLGLGRSTVDRYLAGHGRQPAALAATTAAQSAASQERAQANYETARDMEARGFGREVIAGRLGVSRRRVGELLGPPDRKETRMEAQLAHAGHKPSGSGTLLDSATPQGPPTWQTYREAAGALSRPPVDGEPLSQGGRAYADALLGGLVRRDEKRD